ncbi:MAG: hypothetical protein ACYSWU_13185 [Planctomycetota bacterium]|jgi:hypothetical protein
MKRITWTVVLLAVGLLAAGCTKVETDDNPGPASGAQPADPAVPGQPAENEGDAKSEKGVAGAIGTALLKGITGGSESEKDRPDEAPEFEP